MDFKTGVSEAECRIHSAREVGTTKDCGIYLEAGFGMVRTVL